MCIAGSTFHKKAMDSALTLLRLALGCQLGEASLDLPKRREVWKRGRPSMANALLSVRWACCYSCVVLRENGSHRTRHFENLDDLVFT